MKIAYIILHYMAYDDTIECTNSILDISNNCNHDVKIIIVDNGSSNNSCSILKEKYKDNNNVTIIINDSNLGFAKGNNVGFLYAKNIFKADFIVQLNNDTIINQTDFNDRIIKLYDQNTYAVLGPDIITLDGCHQNPVKNVNWTFFKLFIFRTKKIIQYLMTFIPFMDKYLHINESSFRKHMVDRIVIDTTLHGACYIFSSDYISKFDGLYDKTFLYMEEDILKLRADYYGYKMIYSPDVRIIHKEDIATNMIVSSSIKKKRWVYKNLINSSKVYMKLKREYCKDNAKVN